MNESNHMSTADRLRLLADWLDTHPQAQHGSVSIDSWGEGTILDARADDAEHVARLAREIGGTWTKDGDETYFYLRQKVPGGFDYQLYLRRELACERVVVGTEVVEVPDPEALAAVPTRPMTRDVIEWLCPPSILQGRAA